MKIEQEFSSWLVDVVKRDPEHILNTDKLTLEALAWIQEESTGAVDLAMKRGIPVVAVINSSFLAGVTIGFLFREWLNQEEELPL